MNKNMTTWRCEFKKILDGDIIISSTLTEKELDKEFYDGFGCAEGIPFTAWSEKYVYFPVTYDGAEWVSRVPRNPDLFIPTQHVGGE